LSLEHEESLLLQLFEAIRYIHDQGVIHRDIKPANMFVQYPFLVGLGDFGIACQMTNGKCTGACGTPLYRAPETATAFEYDESVDIWSAAVSMMEICEGLPPRIAPNNATQAEYITRWTDTIAEHAAQLDRGKPTRDIYLQLLKKEPSERLQAKAALQEGVIRGMFYNSDGVFHHSRATVRPLKSRPSLDP
jgi:serine/threonine protein kinase